MIWESCHWKDPLIDLADKIKSWENNSKLDEPDFVEIERELMLGFYSIRKLVDSKKLTDRTEEEALTGKSFQNVKNVNSLNWHKIDQLYDLDSPKITDLKLDFVYNQIIHSYVFQISEDRNGFGGIYFCSDYKRNEFLYFISSPELKRILRIVGNDYPAHSHRAYNKDKKDYDITKL